MSALPLPKVAEISFDDIVTLLPADCKIRLTACEIELPVAQKHEREMNTQAGRPANDFILVA